MVSIIIPIYNTIQFLGETIQCILRQTLQDFEVLLVSDGCDFNLSEFLIDERFKLLSQEHKGVSAARNLGLDNAKGDYILCLDSDDLISNNYIEESVKFLQNGYSLVRPLCCYFGNKQSIDNRDWKSYKDEIRHNCLFVSCMFHKTEIRFDETMSRCEDWDFFVRYLKNNDNVADCKKIRLFYRQHDNQSTKLNNSCDEIIKCIQKINKKSTT